MKDFDCIILQKNQSCLFIQEANGHFFHFLIENSNFKDLSSQITKIKTFKFIGQSFVLDSLIQSFPQLKVKIEKSLFPINELEILFNSQNGQIKVSKEAAKIEKKRKVLIVDDSKTIQKLISKIISTSSELEVMAIANDPEEAIQIIDQMRPDIITLDLHMPKQTGLEFLKGYLNGKHIPVVMISSVSLSEGPQIIDALSSGALDYIQKPSFDSLDVVAPLIIQKLETLSRIKVDFQSKNLLTSKPVIRFQDTDGLIAIGSSTGGTQALQEIFTQLPAQIPPIVVTQHIPPVFSKALADRLNSLCPFLVKEAEDGEILKPNTVYIAPGGKQFKLRKEGSIKRVVITNDAPVNRFIPSVDYLFNSLVDLKEKNLVAFILTGMGKDGAQGLLKLKKAGATTIAQSEKGCIVFGMPREAINLEAHCHIIELKSIPSKMVEIYNCKKIKKAS
ncbi:MAG: protein-glutamate methylesterase/protein-glutamine glutaminase [Bacteriovoracaceae bacterium]